MAFRAGIILAVAAGVGCGTAEPPRTAPSAPPPRAVRTVAAHAQAGAGGSAPATVVARSHAVLAARFAGTVTALPLREGDAFAAGAVLVRLDARAPAAAQAAAEADLAVAETDRARMESLRAKGAATPREAEQAAARAGAARAAMMAAREAFAYAQLRAPFPGRVATRPVNVGDVVSPGTPLLEIEGADGFELRASLGAGEAAPFRPGTRIRAAVDGMETPVEGRVRSLSAAGDPLTHRFELRADLALTSGLRSGLFARLMLPAAAGDGRLTVPSSAVFARGGLSGVYVIADGRARLRWIAAGAASEGQTEVRAGLAAGERVALEPAGLEDGTPAAEAR
ncbi:MAG TPA: efflux RND transporter periplasmic adaptor subunit [Vicinamibacteria bacterium]|nr:efflux RND transporter periplasmic adaptor subunit [Vicinamibacteria bacterium]